MRVAAEEGLKAPRSNDFARLPLSGNSKWNGMPPAAIPERPCRSWAASVLTEAALRERFTSNTVFKTPIEVLRLTGSVFFFYVLLSFSSDRRGKSQPPAAGAPSLPRLTFLKRQQRLHEL